MPNRLLMMDQDLKVRMSLNRKRSKLTFAFDCFYIIFIIIRRIGMEKEAYIEVKIETITFDTSDIICGSNCQYELPEHG